MSGRGGRDRFHRDYPPRSEEKNHLARGNPPSRHLWVGNLSHDLDESTLARHFLRFGDLESVAYQPGRSYAFINFRDENDAFAAVRELQGFSIAGLPLKIEFAKADKSTPRRGEEDYMPDRDEQLPIVRSSPFSQRETRARHTSDAPYADKSKMNDKNAEPSEVLWVGFPAQLKVDEFILRKAFLPFGEIDRITAFPGRTYAFVRFKRISAACRAKETLQGKLFDNPRVHICFARSESGGSSSRERDSLNAPLSPDFIPHGRQGISEDFHHDREFGTRAGELGRNSPDFVSNLEPDYPDFRSFGRKNAAWSGEKGAFDKRRFPELGSETEKTSNMYQPRKRQQIDRGGHFRDFSPEEFPRQGPFYDDPFDLPEDPLLFSETKRSFPHANELPEYPFSDSGQINRMPPSRPYTDFRHNPYERNTDSEAFGYNNYKHNPDRLMQLNQPYVERNDLKNVPFDGHIVGPDPLVAHPERKQLTPESYRPFKAEEWKWEGTIAKGGTPICRARCFPVGAVMDLILPEFLDCTAKTSLDALTKHYYQAASSWVVFFVAASDPDMALYNEFMNYLGDKQRAAVAKLDDRTTLFLVPPSDFSEKILKVPGKLSISGVVLRLEQQQQPSSSGYVPVHLQQEQNKPNFVPSSLDNNTSSVPYLPSSLPTFERHGTTNTSVSGNFSAGLPPPPPPRPGPSSIGNFPDLAGEYAPHHQQNPITGGPGWSAHNIQNTSANNRNMMNLNPVITQGGYNPPVPASSNRSSNSAAFQDKPLLPSSVTAAFQPEQLVQLASTLLEQQQQRQSGGVTTEWQQHQRYSLPSNQFSSDLSSQYVPVHQQQQQQQQQMPNMVDSNQRETQPNTYVNQQQQTQFAGNEEGGDTEKRLQATLQLAAALIQQIQHGKGTPK